MAAGTEARRGLAFRHAPLRGYGRRNHRPTAAAPPPAPAVAAAVASVPAPSPGPSAAPPASAATVPRLTDDQLIRVVLQRYRVAYEELNARSAQAVWPTVDVAALGRAFQG